MSVVVAIKDKDKVWIGTDSQVSGSWIIKELTNENNCKIQRLSDWDSVLVGVVGRLKMNNLIAVEEGLFSAKTIYKDKEIDFKKVVQEFCPRVKSASDKYDLNVKDKDGNFQRTDGSFVLAHNKSLFQVASDLCVIEIDDYVATGSGSELAIGYLASSKDESPQTRIEKAIKSACVHNDGVYYPIHIMNTENKEVIRIDK